MKRSVCVCVCVCDKNSQHIKVAQRTSDGNVSSTRILGPVVSGPNAQMDLAARRSQSYLVWKNSPNRFLGHVICTTSFSMSSARPFSSGSAIIVILFLHTRHSDNHYDYCKYVSTHTTLHTRHSNNHYDYCNYVSTHATLHTWHYDYCKYVLTHATLHTRHYDYCNYVSTHETLSTLSTHLLDAGFWQVL